MGEKLLAFFFMKISCHGFIFWIGNFFLCWILNFKYFIVADFGYEEDKLYKKSTSIQSKAKNWGCTTKACDGWGCGIKSIPGKNSLFISDKFNLICNLLVHFYCSELYFFSEMGHVLIFWYFNSFVPKLPSSYFFPHKQLRLTNSQTFETVVRRIHENCSFVLIVYPTNFCKSDLYNHLMVRSNCTNAPKWSKHGAVCVFIKSFRKFNFMCCFTISVFGHWGKTVCCWGEWDCQRNNC